MDSVDRARVRWLSHLALLVLVGAGAQAVEPGNRRPAKTSRPWPANMPPGLAPAPLALRAAPARLRVHDLLRLEAAGEVRTARVTVLK